MTNEHVVRTATKISVSLPGGETLDAQLVGSDLASDLALIKVESQEDLPYLDFRGDEGALVENGP